MRVLKKFIWIARYLAREYVTALSALLPNDVLSCRLRRLVLMLVGIKVGSKTLIYRNVLITGNVTIGENSSISNNTCINGSTAGIVIGPNVMIAPGCCIVAFSHGTTLGHGPMIQQAQVEAPILIEDDVWIGANSTITAGVKIGTGAVIAANSVVTTDIAPGTIVGGAPARFLRMRQ